MKGDDDTVTETSWAEVILFQSRYKQFINGAPSKPIPACLLRTTSLPPPLQCWEAVMVLKKLLIVSPAWVRPCSVLGEMWCEGRGLRCRMLIPSPCMEQLWRQDSELGSNPGDPSCLSRSARKPLPMVMSSSPLYQANLTAISFRRSQEMESLILRAVCLF